MLSLLKFPFFCCIPPILQNLLSCLHFPRRGCRHTGWDYQDGKKIKSRILVVSVGKRVHAVDNARWDRERGEGKSFDVASCTEVEEPIGTLKVSCCSEAYSGFCSGLHGVSCEGFSCAWTYAPN